jgi:hypothetical protein
MSTPIPNQRWIVDAYALVFAGLLLPARALGDRIGREGVLISGLTMFGPVVDTTPGNLTSGGRPACRP